MSKYSIARAHIDQCVEEASGENIDDFEMVEALIVSAVEHLTALKGGSHTRPFLQYELDNVASDGVFEIQKR